MRLVSRSIPCTDAYCDLLRHRLQSLQFYFGLPALFITLNPADTRHPFTLRFATGNSWSFPETCPDFDAALSAALQKADLALLVATDPVAVTRAFHHHIVTFLTTILGCASSAATLSSDGLASTSGGGIFGPIAAYFGVTEPQLRGSLHLHMLVHVYGFSDIDALLRTFQANLPLLQRVLLQWADSLCQASLESLPSVLGVPEAAATFRHLQPLAYSRAQCDRLVQQLGSNWGFTAAANCWHFASSSPTLAESPWFDAFGDAVSESSPHRPWPRQYLAPSSSASTPLEWARMLLFHARHAALYSCLHDCRPRTCHKGKLGRHGFCRLGFWHWRDISDFTQPDTWQRCHGHALSAQSCVGHTPPHSGALLSERHHPYHTRFNISLLTLAKCNHDIAVLLRAPVQAFADDFQALADTLASSVTSATFYITSYVTKSQPHLTNLWFLLRSGQERLQRDLQSTGNEDPRYIASRALTRMLTAADKRNHKSLPEICHYLLGHDEAYTSHDFQALYTTTLVRTALQLLPVPSLRQSEPETTAVTSA